MSVPIDLSYLADSIVLLRFFEAGGEVRKAISVMKKRTGRHESSIREL
jgi:circadian clock protein KaiC